MEILAGNMDRYCARSGIKAIKKYDNKEYQVWELAQNEFDKLNNTDETSYKSDEWWRGSDGSNMGLVNATYKINGHDVRAWDGNRRELDIEDGEEIFGREYASLTDYFCDEIGASQPCNVCALAIDLAAQNNMTMAELFNKYQSIR